MLSTLRTVVEPSYAKAGVVISIPILAFAQGAYFLINYRRNHGDAPYPVSPSRGIVVVSPQDSSSNTMLQQQQKLQRQSSSGNEGEKDEVRNGYDNLCQSSNSNNTGQTTAKESHNQLLSKWKQNSNRNTNENLPINNKIHETKQPLRIFVVGDSLAAGVGSTSGTPILPEAIARSLSKALGGRPVHWTCYGTPGASTSRIMKNIKDFMEKDYQSLLLQKMDDEENFVLEGIVTFFQQILLLLNRNKKKNQKKKKKKEEEEEEEEENVIDNTMLDKDENCANLVQKEEMSTSDSIILTSKAKITYEFNKIIDGLKDTLNHSSLNEKEAQEWKQWNISLSPNSILKENVIQYDVVIVLTGLNDLKSIFLPFFQDADGTNDDTFKEELRKVFHFVTKKKKIHHHDVYCDDRKERLRLQNENDDDHHHKEALVVVPALPTHVLPMLQYPPLCWIIHVLLQFMDEEKRALSKEYPGSLLFIEAPTVKMIDEIEKGEYYLCAKRKTEIVLLALKDITLRVRDEIKNLIRKHKEHHDFKDNEREIELHYEASKHHNLSDPIPDGIGSKLVSIDGVHPNDDGYDFWGRHIAEGIIKELRLKDE